MKYKILISVWFLVVILFATFLLNGCVVKTKIIRLDGREFNIQQSSNQNVYYEYSDDKEIIKSETKSIGILESTGAFVFKNINSVLKSFKNMFIGVNKNL
jgi:flagellar biosynthesis protein FlhB